jgi:hypothetical protein
MSPNSKNAKAICLECSKIYVRCATECEKHDSEHMKAYATDCRKAAKMCNEM